MSFPSMSIQQLVKLSSEIVNLGRVAFLPAGEPHGLHRQSFSKSEAPIDKTRAASKSQMGPSPAKKNRQPDWATSKTLALRASTL